MAHNHNKIILQLMIKNESKIIERCIKRAIEHVDAVCILDTGSTDNTIEVCTKVLNEIGKPFKITVEPFKNFGYNRSISFVRVQEFCKELGWDADITYAMAVDADMNIQPQPEFKNYKLSRNGYTVIQVTPALKYYNTRLMKCSYNWKCVGVTHEYWSGEGSDKIPFEVFHIDDVNDGGCKSDKFERDIRLLSEDLVTDPNNGRTHFYLAQSYRDSGNTKTAIKHYKIRIKIGGWIEEVFQAYYQISKCYASLNDPERAEKWGNLAFKFYPKRAESIYFLAKYFRERGDQYKSYHYYLKGKDIPYPKDDVLFIEKHVYDSGLFEYESTILAFYVYNKSKQDGLYELIQYINKRNMHLDNVWSNMEFYTETLVSDRYKGEYTKLYFPNRDEYNVSSCSIVNYKNNLILNTRYVNYYISDKGTYHTRIPDTSVKTQNGVVTLNSSFLPINDVSMMKEELSATYPNSIEGFEDVRLFMYNDKLHFSASTKSMTNDDKFWIAVGEYNIENKTICNVSTITPPQPSYCEKNWIYIPDSCLRDIKESRNKMNFIYNWHPLQIGAIDENKQLIIHTIRQTPTIFSKFRGSSNLCEYDGYLWGVIHIVKHCSGTSRIYSHALVKFNRDTLMPVAYSLPFYFKKAGVEYCLGLHIKDGKVCFIFSQNDTDPSFITMPLSNLRMMVI